MTHNPLPGPATAWRHKSASVPGASRTTPTAGGAPQSPRSRPAHHLIPPFLALGFALAGSIDYDPQILTLTWPDGRSERIAATAPDTCTAAAEAIERGLWLPVGSAGKPAARCAPGDIFQPCGRFIAGFNAPATCRK